MVLTELTTSAAAVGVGAAKSFVSGITDVTTVWLFRACHPQIRVENETISFSTFEANNTHTCVSLGKKQMDTERNGSVAYSSSVLCVGLYGPYIVSSEVL